jgi:hypothetical protein
MLNNLLTKTVVDPSLGFRHCASHHVMRGRIARSNLLERRGVLISENP